MFRTRCFDHAASNAHMVATKAMSLHVHKTHDPVIDVDAEVGVAILPTLYLSANWIGGPTATLAPYASAEVGFETAGNCGAVVAD